MSGATTTYKKGIGNHTLGMTLMSVLLEEAEPHDLFVVDNIVKHSAYSTTRCAFDVSFLVGRGLTPARSPSALAREAVPPSSQQRHQLDRCQQREVEHLKLRFEPS